MIRRRDIPGFTLVELLFTLTVLAILVGLAYVPLRRGLDGLAVRFARDALAAGVARARAIAVARGGAALVVDARDARAWIETARGDTVGVPLDLAHRYGVRLETSGADGGPVLLAFDGRGLGLLANRTFLLRRGGQEARLTLSTYGRPRRW